MKEAPWPTPSLWTKRAPPSSLAAMAPLCRPKPWPSLRVVNPWEKMRLRLSAAIADAVVADDDADAVLAGGGDADPDFFCAVIFKHGAFGVVDEVDEDLNDFVAIDEDIGDGQVVANQLNFVALERAVVHGEGVFDNGLGVHVFDDAAELGVVLLHRDDGADVLDVGGQNLGFVGQFLARALEGRRQA